MSVRAPKRVYALEKRDDARENVGKEEGWDVLSSAGLVLGFLSTTMGLLAGLVFFAVGTSVDQRHT